MLRCPTVQAGVAALGYTYIYLGLQRGRGGRPARNPDPCAAPASRVVRPQTATTGTPAGRARAGHAHGRLAQQALFVQAAFAGDHQVGAGQPSRQFGEFKHDVDARPAGRGQDGDGRVADAAGRPGAGRVRGLRWRADRFPRPGLPQTWPGRRRACDVLRCGALLRAENRRGALGAQQGVVDVGGQHKACLLQAGFEPGEVDAVQVGQGGAAGGQFVARRRPGTWRRGPAGRRRRRRCWRCRRRPG